MHLYINMNTEDPAVEIPIQYNHLVQSAIYASLPEETANWLHNEGFMSGKRSFRLFAFSRLIGNYIINKNSGTISFPEGARLIVSSPDNHFLQGLVNGLLTKSSFRVGDCLFDVTGVECEGQVVNDDFITVRSLSPIVVYSTLLKPEGGKYTCYFQPGEAEFAKHIINNLRKKYEAFFQQPAPDGEFQVRPLDRPRLHITSYKNTVIKGYSCRLRLKGPRELLQMALDAGLGSKNSQGYGCVERIKGAMVGGAK